MNGKKDEFRDSALIQSWTSPTLWLDSVRHSLYSTALLTAEASISESNTSLRWRGRIAMENWPWRSKPASVLTLPSPPAVSVLLTIGEDERVSVRLIVMLEDVNVPGGLLEGFRNVAIPRCFVNRAGQPFYPDPNDFLQVYREEDYSIPEDFQVPEDLSLPPWHYRRFRPESPKKRPKSPELTEPWEHPFNRPRFPERRPGRRGGHFALPFQPPPRDEQTFQQHRDRTPERNLDEFKQWRPRPFRPPSYPRRGRHPRPRQRFQDDFRRGAGGYRPARPRGPDPAYHRGPQSRARHWRPFNRGRPRRGYRPSAPRCFPRGPTVERVSLPTRVNSILVWF